MRNSSLSRELDAISLDVIQAAIAVHKALGPGLLERVYRLALLDDLEGKGHVVRAEVPLDAEYRGRPLGLAYRIDLLVDEAVVVEVKSVEALLDVHSKQVLTYLRLSGKRLGILVNFNEQFVRDGIRRVVR